MKKLLYLVLAPCLVLLNGCKTPYKAKKLAPVKAHATLTHEQEEPHIIFSYEIFDKQDCFDYLGRDVLARGYQPLHITLVNNTLNPFEFSTTKFSFPVIDFEDVADAVHTDTIRKVLGYGIPALIIWPLWIPAVVEGIRSANANMKLDRDYARKTLRDQIVMPSQKIDGIVFVPVDQFDEKFTCVVTDIITREHHTLNATRRAETFVSVR
jgi:hypothetical protein